MSTYGKVYFVIGRLNGAKHHSDYTLHQYSLWMLENKPERQLVCWSPIQDQYDQNPTTVGGWHRAMVDHLSQGRYVLGQQPCIDAFDAWAELNGLPSYREATGLRAKPKSNRTVIVQDFVLEVPSEEVARRAWAATMAMCGE